MAGRPDQSSSREYSQGDGGRRERDASGRILASQNLNRSDAANQFAGFSSLNDMTQIARPFTGACRFWLTLAKALGARSSGGCVVFQVAPLDGIPCSQCRVDEREFANFRRGPRGPFWFHERAAPIALPRAPCSGSHRIRGPAERRGMS